MTDTEVGRRIREIRDQKGITQEQLADAAGLTRPYLSNLERGIATNPRLETLRAIAAALGCDLEILFRPRR